MLETNTKRKVPITDLMKDNFNKRGIYCFKDKNTNKILYIGSTSDNFKKRLMGHEKFQTNWKLYEAIINEVVVFDLLEVFEEGTYRELIEREARLIKQHRPLCNIQFKNDLDVEEDIASQIKVGKLNKRKLAQTIN